MIQPASCFLYPGKDWAGAKTLAKVSLMIKTLLFAENDEYINTT